MARKINQLVRAKKVEVVEVLPPEIQLGVVSIEEARIKDIAQRQVAEILASRDDFQPYFQDRRVAQELKKLQSVPQQRSWSLVYEQYGCTHCNTKKRTHAGCGMCRPCKTKWLYRKKAAARQLSGEKEIPIPRKCDGCGRRFPAMTDAKWESAYEQHEVSKHHTRRFFYGRLSRHPRKKAVERSCSVCHKYFRPMSDEKWKYVCKKHERGERHRRALKKGRHHANNKQGN